MKRLLALGIALLMLVAVMTGCAKKDTAEPNGEQTEQPGQTEKTDWEYIQSKGKLTIGITEYAPMNYYDENGTLIGFDTEFAQAVCEKLGVEPEFVVIDWDSKEIELKAKTIDCIWNGLTVQEDRKENMDFTSSYLCNQQVIVINASNAEQYTKAEDFEGLTVVAEESSAGATAVAQMLSSAEFIAVDSQSNALMEVKAGTAEAAVIDLTMAQAMTGEGTEYADLLIVQSVDMPDEEYAIGCRLGSDMVAKLNTVVEELSGKGTLDELAEKYELTELLIKN